VAATVTSSYIKDLGHVAEWLRNGLQNRVRRFNSGRGLQSSVGKPGLGNRGRQAEADRSKQAEPAAHGTEDAAFRTIVLASRPPSLLACRLIEAESPPAPDP
jgi:hypothetical protein